MRSRRATRSCSINSKLLYPLFRKIAFKFDPEWVHDQAFFGLDHFSSFWGALLSQPFAPEKFSVKLKSCDLSLPFPVGLAAGLDKNARALDVFSRLSFGALEIGTVTPKPQPGNPRPRLFRLSEQASLRNAMGFNNDGMEVVAKRLKAFRPKRPVVIGVNLGKNKDTPAERASEDYRLLYGKLARHSDYVVINVSSPNTPGLRLLQAPEELEKIFSALAQLRKEIPRPLFLKVSPDLNHDDLPSIIEVAQKYALSGLVATNTTSMPELGPGGISGRLLKERSKKMRRRLLELTRSTKLDVIGVGGIDCFQDVREFWEQGGRFCQVYTSFIYQGPPLLTDIREGMESWMKKQKLDRLNDYFTKV